MAETLIGLRRGIGVLEHLAIRGPQTFNALKAEYSGVSSSTLSRLLKTLQDEGLVENASGGGYRLAERSKRLGRYITDNLSLVERVDPILLRLARHTGESAAFFEFQDTAVMLLAKVEMPERFHYSPVGSTNVHFDRHGFSKLLFAHLAKKDQKRIWSLRERGRGVTFSYVRDEFAAIAEKDYLVNYKDDQKNLIRVCALVTYQKRRCAIGITLWKSAADTKKIDAHVAAIRDAQQDVLDQYEKKETTP